MASKKEIQELKKKLKDTNSLESFNNDFNRLKALDPTAPQTLGDAFRSSRKDAEEDIQRRNAKRAKHKPASLAQQKTVKEGLNAWFNAAASRLTHDISQNIIYRLNGAPASSHVYFDAGRDDFYRSPYNSEDHGINCYGALDIDIKALSGFQQFDAACKKLNVDFTTVVEKSYYDYNDVIDRTGSTEVKIVVDLEKPYTGNNKLRIN